MHAIDSQPSLADTRSCVGLGPFGCDDDRNVSKGSDAEGSDGHCMSSAISPFYPPKDYKTSLTVFLKRMEEKQVFGLNKKEDIESDKSTAHGYFQHVDFLSSFGLNFENRTDIHNSRQSQDDSLNSANHPKLFNSRFQQPWSVRFYKFQLGLINTREVLRVSPLL
jgi:hypothetical protein